jgi:hypothetical protein
MLDRKVDRELAGLPEYTCPVVHEDNDEEL